MKVIKPLIITGSILLTLLILVALLTPPIAKNYINKHSKELIGRKVHLEGLYLNLFTGYTRLTGFQMFEADDQQAFVRFDTLTVDVSLFRLLANELRINQIHLIGPDVRVLQQGAAFNFDDLLAPGTSDSSALASSTPVIPDTTSVFSADTTVVSGTSALPENGSGKEESMAIAIYDIAIRGGHIYYEDQIRHSVWEMENFGLDIPGIYFSGQNTNVGLGLNFNDGGQLQTTMQYNLEAGNYTLSIDLTDFSISPIRPYLADFMKVSRIDGILSTHLDIEGNATHVTDLNIRGNLGLRKLALRDERGEEVFATDSLFVGLENIDPGKAIFHFNTINVDGIRTAFSMRKDGNTLSDLLITQPADTTVAATPAITDPEATASPAPDFRIATFRIGNSAFTFQDHTLHTPFRFRLENITLTADNLNLESKNKAKISSTLENGGTILFNYEGKFDEFKNTDLLLSIKNLDLKSFTPYSMQYFGYPMTKGILSFSSINNIRNNQLDGRNNLNIARCEVGRKQKDPKPEYNIPLKTALYLIKDRNDQIKMDLPVSGDIESPEFSYRKIIMKTLTNLLIKVAVSPVSFLANSLGFSPDQLKALPFEATQNDFTPEQLDRINQLAAIIKTKPEMTLVMEQCVDLQQNKTGLAHFYVKRNYYLQQHPEKTAGSLLPIDYTRIVETDIKAPEFLSYVRQQVSEELQTALPDVQILSLADSVQLEKLTHDLIQKRNEVLKTYLLRQQVPEKCLRISTIPEDKLLAYKGKNLYTIHLVLEEEVDNDER